MLVSKVNKIPSNKKQVNLNSRFNEDLISIDILGGKSEDANDRKRIPSAAKEPHLTLASV